MTTATEATAAPSDRFRFRVRLAAACVILLGLAMTQSPGFLVPDTKFDLVLDPEGFLGRAMHLWDAEGAFGQLQNQAYGYLWPMGPFFLLGSLADVPGWVIQRLWLTLVMCVALTGATKVTRELGVRSDLACLLAGFAYALSPRMLSTLGLISIEAWPSALAPWVLLPLVIGSTRGSARRAAGWSAVAVAMVGGVNAAATSAVLPLGALWLLTRTPGPRRRTMMLWWPLFTALGTAWWLVSLFVMGAYSPPFLDFIETASNTTFPTTLFDALRGTSNWVPYVDSGSVAGNDLIRQFHVILNSGAVLALGAVGLMLRGNPHRLFLVLGVIAGLLLVTMGHQGAVQGWAAGDLHALLDGVLAPVRNVHKFDPVIRLPLVVGLAWTVDEALRRLRAARSSQGSTNDSLRRVNARVVVATAVLAVIGASLPALAGRIAPAGGLLEVPDYWSEAAAWLEEEKEGTALLVPGSSFGVYQWGSPRDEPMQALADSPWAVRNAVPLAPAGNIRMLDAVERRLAQGAPSPGLADYLRRAGVTHVVVRNDLAGSNDLPDPVLVHQSLAGSPDLFRAATFGPQVGGQAHLLGDDARIVVNGGWQYSRPAIEVYEVARTADPASTSDLVPTVVGGPEDLLDLAALEVIGDEPTVLAADVDGEPDLRAPLVLTDGLRATERNFGRLHDANSATLSDEDPLRMPRTLRDYLLDDDERWSTRARLHGAASVSASSSVADVNAYGTVQPGQLPYAALDGHDETRWVSNLGVDEDAWWQVDFETARPVDRVSVTAGPDRQLVRVVSEDTTSEAFAVPAGATRTVDVDTDATRWLRVEDASGRATTRLSLAEVEVPELSTRRALVLPATPVEWGQPDSIVLRAVSDARSGCATVDQAVRCVARRAVAAEEPLGFDRDVDLAAPATYTPDLRVQARPGRGLEEFLLAGLPIGITSSSTSVDDVRASAIAAVDGDPGTSWTASLDDLSPQLRLNWLGVRRISGLTVHVARGTAARLPDEVTLLWPGGSTTAEVDRNGEVRFRPIRTDRLTVRVDTAESVDDLGFDSANSKVPVGISELRVKGLPLTPVLLSEEETRSACGVGPSVQVGGDTFDTAVTASPAQVYRGEIVPAELCDVASVRLESGANEIDLEASDAFTPTSLVLSTTEPATTQPATTQPATTEPANPEPALARLDAAGGTITPAGETASLLTVRQNHNRGWVARQNGEALEPVVVDGWMQGWRLAGAEGPVSLRFEPDRAYRWGLAAGFAAFGVLLLVVMIAGRRWRGAQDEALSSRAVSGATLGVCVLGAGGLLAGAAGVGLAGVAFLVAAVLTRRLPDQAPWVLASPLLLAAAAYAVQPWGGGVGWAGDLAWPHYVVLLIPAFVLGSLAVEPGRHRRRARPIAGLSTRR